MVIIIKTFLIMFFPQIFIVLYSDYYSVVEEK
jgi:hypothetical protein